MGTLSDIGGKSFLDGTFLMQWALQIVHIAVTVCGRPVLQKDSAVVVEEGPTCHVSNILSLCSGSESVTVVCRDLNEAHEKEGIDIRYHVYGSCEIVKWKQKWCAEVHETCSDAWDEPKRVWEDVEKIVEGSEECCTHPGCKCSFF